MAKNQVLNRIFYHFLANDTLIIFPTVVYLI